MALAAAIALLLSVHAVVSQGPASSPQPVADDTTESSSLETAQRSFFNGDYTRAAMLSLMRCEARPDDLDACELRTASLHFEIKKALGETGQRDKSDAWNRCTRCPALMAAFIADTVRGQAFARAKLKSQPDQERMLFFLGKMNLNYVWLQSGTLGRKTGWDEYWEARRSLDRVLRLNPEHTRARVARAWVDYIVGTTVPRGARWLLGGGNKKRGLLVVAEVVDRGRGTFFDQSEARFALWDMQVRERDVPAAITTAQRLVREFPENRELRRFLSTHDPTTGVAAPARPAP